MTVIDRLAITLRQHLHIAFAIQPIMSVTGLTLLLDNHLGPRCHQSHIAFHPNFAIGICTKLDLFYGHRVHFLLNFVRRDKSVDSRLVIADGFGVIALRLRARNQQVSIREARVPNNFN